MTQKDTHTLDRKERMSGAMYVAERAAAWFNYSTWHPDFDTLNFIRAWQDYLDRVPIEDVYWARGEEMPKVNKYGVNMPILAFPPRGK